MFEAQKPQRMIVDRTLPLHDGTYILATLMPDMPGRDLGYVILSHLKVDGYSFDYHERKPSGNDLKGWDIDNIKNAVPDHKVLGTKILTREEYDALTGAIDEAFKETPVLLAPTVQ